MTEPLPDQWELPRDVCHNVLQRIADDEIRERLIAVHAGQFGGDTYCFTESEAEAFTDAFVRYAEERK